MGIAKLGDKYFLILVTKSEQVCEQIDHQKGIKEVKGIMILPIQY